MTPSSIVADEPVAAALVANVVAEATPLAYPVVCVIALSAVYSAKLTKVVAIAALTETVNT